MNNSNSENDESWGKSFSENEDTENLDTTSPTSEESKGEPEESSLTLQEMKDHTHTEPICQSDEASLTLQNIRLLGGLLSS